MKAFECTGQWWLPDDEQHGVAGTLKVSQSGELRLRLFGSLGADPGHPFKEGTSSSWAGWKRTHWVTR